MQWDEIDEDVEIPDPCREFCEEGQAEQEEEALEVCREWEGRRGGAWCENCVNGKSDSCGSSYPGPL